MKWLLVLAGLVFLLHSPVSFAEHHHPSATSVGSSRPVDDSQRKDFSDKALSLLDIAGLCPDEIETLVKSGGVAKVVKMSGQDPMGKFHEYYLLETGDKVEDERSYLLIERKEAPTQADAPLNFANKCTYADIKISLPVSRNYELTTFEGTDVQALSLAALCPKEMRLLNELGRVTVGREAVRDASKTDAYFEAWTVAAYPDPDFKSEKIGRLKITRTTTLTPADKYVTAQHDVECTLTESKQLDRFRKLSESPSSK